MPLFLAVSKPLNFVVPAQTILATYGVLLLAAVIGSQLLARISPTRTIRAFRGQSKAPMKRRRARSSVDLP
jgi:hypothetical protein